MRRAVASGLFALAAALVCAPSAALDPQRQTYQYVYEAWSLEEGLPQSSVFAIEQTPDGYLWLATAEGLVRFDGVRFEVFDKSNTSGLRSNWITTLELDSHGALWFGGNSGGLTRYAEGRFETYGEAQGLANHFVATILEDLSGRLWVGTLGGGLYRFEHDRLVSEVQPEGRDFSEVWDLIEDSARRLWVATNAGVYSFSADDGQPKDFEIVSGLSSDRARVLFEDRHGTYWIGTYEGGLNRLRHGFVEHLGEADGLTARRFFSMFEDSAGSLWIGSSGNGLYRYENGAFSGFGTKDGLSDDSVRAFFEDTESNLWVGTYGGGLVQLRDGKFTAYTTRSGLSHNYAFAMCEERGGAVWIGTYGGGLNQWKDGRFRQQPLATPEPQRIGALVCSPNGELWVGTYGAGLYLVRDGESVPFKGRERLAQMSIAALHLDSRGRLWIGTNSYGAFVLEGDSLTKIDKAEGLPSQNVQVISEDASGSIWLGTDAGLIRYKDKPRETLTMANGLLSDVVFSLAPQPDGSLWIGTYGGGLSRWKGGQLRSVAKRDGLSDDVVYTIVDDRHGKIWMTSNRGVSTVDRQELEAFFDGTLTQVHSTVYGIPDGLKSSECNGGFQPSSCLRQDGTLLLPTLAGFVSIDPGAIALNQQLPPVRIEAVVADGRDHAPDRNVELPAGTRRVEFQYTALSFVASDKVRFRYRLDGFDSEWIEAAGRRVAYYTNLPPGAYRFRVIAANSDGLWNEQGASVRLNKLPRFYETLWFRVLILVALVLAVYGVFVVRLHRIKVRNLELERLVEERTRGLELAHQQIVQLEKETTERQMAGGFAHEMRNALAAASLTLRKILAFTPSGESLSASRSHLLVALFKELRSILSKEEIKSVAVKLNELNQSDKQLDLLVDKAKDSIERSLAVTDQILSYAQIGREQPGQDPVLLLGLLDEIAREHAEEWERRGIALIVEVPGAARVMGTKQQGYAIFNNLLLNAADAWVGAPTQTNRAKVIAVSASPEGSGWKVVIRDNGEGIEEADLPRVFEPFFSTKPAKGTGLGLNVVKKYMKMLQGTVTIESERHRGTVVTLWFP